MDEERLFLLAAVSPHNAWGEECLHLFAHSTCFVLL